MTDLEFIQSPNEWPRWPALPLVFQRSEGRPLCGLILDCGKPKVYMDVNIFGLGERPGNTWGEKLEGVKTLEYDSYASLLKEWRID